MEILQSELLNDKSQNIHPDKWINKDNNLIKAAYKLTLTEQRIIIACIAQIDSRKGYFNQPNKPINQFYLLKAKDYAETYNLELKNVYTELKNAVDRLFNRYVYTADKKWSVKHRWLSSISWSETESAVKLSFTREIEPYLLGLYQKFTSYQLKSIASLSSVYSIRIYELLMMFKKTNRLDIKLDEFKKALDIEDKYTKFSNLRARVLDPAIKELTEKNNMIIELETVRKGRKIDRLIFKFKDNPQAKLI